MNPDSSLSSTPLPTVSTTTTAPASPNPTSYTNFANNTSPPGSEFTPFSNWGNGYYFMGAYLPTIIAVLYGLIWKCVFVRLKEMEPMYQLASGRGQYGTWSLYLKYADTALPKTATSSVSNGHWLVFMGVINLVLVTLVTAFSPEVLYIRTTGDCGPTGNGNHCKPHLAIRAPLAWVLGAVVFVILIIGVVLAFKLRRRRSGIFSEATSIAGIATLVRDPSLPRILGQSHDDPYPFEKYGFGHCDDPDGSQSYGLVSETPPDITRSYSYQPPVAVKPKGSLLTSLPALALLWFIIIGVLVLIVLYRYVSKIQPGNGFETFMDSQSIGVRLLFSCIGLGIRTWWAKLDEWNREIAPYQALIQARGASAERSILLSSKAHALTALLSTQSLRNPVNGLVSLIAALGEVLIVTLSGVPFTNAESYLAFNISVLLSVAILGLMILVLPVLAWRFHHCRSHVPRPPECVADTIKFLSDSETLSLFDGLSELDEKKRNAAINGLNVRWGLEQGVNGEWTLKASMPP
jgi:hypothetical protein